MAQFTAINGKKIPNELYKDGENFSTTISTNCTIVAMVAINMMNDKKTFKAFRVEEENEKFVSAIKEMPFEVIEEGEVLIKVH